MIVELLVTWGVTQMAGGMVKSILEDIAKDLGKDQGKDYLKRYFGNNPKSDQIKTLERVLGITFKELLKLIQDELLDAGLTDEQTQAWTRDIKQFIRGEQMQRIMRQVLTTSDSTVSADLLLEGWRSLPEPVSLPPEFSWKRVAGRFSRAIHSLRESDKELRDVLLAQTATETADAVRRMAGIDPGFDLEKYREALLERYGNLDFQTLDTTGAFYGVKLWAVFIPQTVRDCQDYVPQHFELPKAHVRNLLDRGEFDDSDLEIAEEIINERQRAYIDQSPQPVLEVLADTKIGRIVILGDPGSGKSSLLRYLALQWARAEDANDRYFLPLPVLIELREYDRWPCSNGKSFIRYLQEAQTSHRFDQLKLDAKLREPGKAVMLLDGLDEIFDPSRREQAINDIHRFSNDYPQTRVIVSSRVIGYKQQRLTDAQFRHFMLQDLDDRQIAEFVNRWHDSTFNDDRDRAFKKERLTKALSESRAIRELAGNPLLVTMMAILNRNQELPRDRAQLYQQSSRILLHEWDTGRALESYPQIKDIISYREKEEILCNVADFMQSAPAGLAGNIIAQEDLERILKDYLKTTLESSNPLAAARAIMNQLRERNFILCFIGGDRYAFVHRTFLEYFCASAIVDRFHRKQSMTFDQLRDDIFGKHWNQETWHEVLCLIAGQIDEVFIQKIIDYLLDQKDRDFTFHHLFLAARCCQEARNPRALGETRKRICLALKKLVRFDFPYFYDEWGGGEEVQRRRVILAKSIGLLAAPQFLDNAQVFLKDRAVNDDHWIVRETAVRELARGWKNDPDILQWLKDCAVNNNNYPIVRETALSELTRGWKDDPDILNLLKDRIANDNYGRVRGAAVRELARGWKNDPNTLSLLKDFATNDGLGNASQAAVSELARGWKNDPDTLNLLKDRAANDDHEFVRRTAISELARSWKDDPDILNLLKDCVAYDDHEFVRETVVRELARGWKNDPDTLNLLKDFATNNDNAEVRQAAISELARGWKNDPDTLNLLKDRATNDDDNEVRETAVRELARRWKNDPDTLNMLKDRAANDDHEFVRRTAISELARGWKDDPDTLNLLKDRATNDDHGKVRQIAVRELARGWRDDPDILQWLKDRAANDDDNEARETAISELACGWKDDPDILQLLKDFATNDHWDVRQTAVCELTRGWRDDPDTLNLLKDRATNDDDNEVRETAVSELARGWRDDPDILNLLKDRAANDDHWYVRRMALSELARGWRDDPDILNLLKDRVANDDNEFVRQTAVSALARSWRDDPDTLNLLKDRVANDDHWEVRRVAVHALARTWKDDPDILNLLKDFATNNDNAEVRQAAVSELARGWKNEPDTLNLLKDRAANDDDWIVRQTAVRELARGWRDDPDTLNLLKDRAANDDNNEVRRVAVRELAHGWKDDPDVLSLLQNRAITDASPEANAERIQFTLGDEPETVRDTAITMIAKYWPDHPETLPLLLDRAQHDPTPWLRKRSRKLASGIEARIRQQPKS